MAAPAAAGAPPQVGRSGESSNQRSGEGEEAAWVLAAGWLLPGSRWQVGTCGMGRPGLHVPQFVPRAPGTLAPLQGQLAAVDPLLPDLLAFPPGTDLHDHPLVAAGALVLQVRWHASTTWHGARAPCGGLACKAGLCDARL